MNLLRTFVLLVCTLGAGFAQTQFGYHQIIGGYSFPNWVDSNNPGYSPRWSIAITNGNVNGCSVQASHLGLDQGWNVLGMYQSPSTYNEAVIAQLVSKAIAIINAPYNPFSDLASWQYVLAAQVVAGMYSTNDPAIPSGILTLISEAQTQVNLLGGQYSGAFPRVFFFTPNVPFVNTKEVFVISCSLF